MADVSGYLVGFNNDASLGGVYSSLAPNLQFLPLCLLASVTVIIIYGTLLAIAKAFNSHELEKHSMAEMLNSGATIVMVLCLIMLLNTVETFTLQYFLCSGTACASFDCAGETITMDNLTNSIDLLKCRLSEKAKAFAEMQGEVTVAAGPPLNLLNTYLSLLGLPVFSGQYVSSWYYEAETYRLLNHFLTVLLIGTNALVVIADYVKNNMLSFFLPLGLLLRSFYFTRGIGAFLVSMALCFYFVYPVIYIITDPGFVKPAFQAPASTVQPEQQLCYPTFSGISQSIFSSMTSSAGGGSATLSLDQLRQDISSVYSSVLLQPFIAFAITIVLMRYMMTVLGGEAMDLLRAVAKVV